MRRQLLTVLAGLLMMLGVRAYAQEPQSLVMARQQYLRQIKPIQQRYIRNLNLMRRKYSQKNDHEAVGAVDREVERVIAHQNVPDEGIRVEKEDEDKYSIADKCMFYRPPDNKWMKILYFRKDGKIMGSNNKNEDSWEQNGKVVSLKDADGIVSGNYRYVKTDDGRLRFENAHKNEIFVLLEEPR
jgi:hypothetical protein